MIELDSCTSEWFKIARELKTKFKTNPLLSMIVKATWGCIQMKNKLEYTKDEIDDKKLDIGLDENSQYKLIGRKQIKDKDIYILVNTKSAYKYKLRLKPFVTAQARYDLVILAIKHLKNIVRIQTDSISFDNVTIEINDTNYAVESKTTGIIHYKNVNCYHNKTTGYTSKNYQL